MKIFHKKFNNLRYPRVLDKNFFESFIDIQVLYLLIILFYYSYTNKSVLQQTKGHIPTYISLFLTIYLTKLIQFLINVLGIQIFSMF